MASKRNSFTATGWPGDDWTVTMLRQLLAVKGVAAAADSSTALVAAKLPQHKLGATLLSLLEQERKLTLEEAAELATYRKNSAYYGELAAMLGEAVPGIRVMKGPTIAARYPKGLLRPSADLDLLCTREQLWQVGATLVKDDSWELSTFSLAPSSRGVEVFAGFEQTTPDENLYEVELKTVDFVSNLRGRQRFTVSWPPLVECILSLLAERFEQPFRSRDLLDLALLLHDINGDQAQILRSGLTAAQLWPQWWEAGTELARMRWLPPGAAVIGGQGEALRGRVAQSASGVMAWLNPATAIPKLLEAGINKASGEWINSLSTVFHERGGAARSFAAGSVTYGVQLDKQSHDGLQLSRRGPHLVAQTPLGSFLMVVGPAQEDWLAQASLHS